GSAFNTSLGNNSSFIKQDDVLFLIDCGSSTFAKIVESSLLEGINEVKVLITHTHPDHVGSLGDLAFYTYYNISPMFKIKLSVYAHVNHSIDKLLFGMGITKDVYTLIEFSDSENVEIVD